VTVAERDAESLEMRRGRKQCGDDAHEFDEEECGASVGFRSDARCHNIGQRCHFMTIVAWNVIRTVTGRDTVPMHSVVLAS
jgi:hypothetical protein